MRVVYLMTADYRKQGEYDLDEMWKAFQEITANGYIAVDIKFDFEGNIIIIIADNTMQTRYEE